METASLPRWLARLFAFLFYGQLVGYVLTVAVLSYFMVADFPEGGRWHFKANIQGDVVAPESMPEMRKNLQVWSKSTFDLQLNVPGLLSLERPADTALDLGLALNGPVSLAAMPTLLWLSGISGLLC